VCWTQTNQASGSSIQWEKADRGRGRRVKTGMLSVTQGPSVTALCPVPVLPPSKDILEEFV
jgi:hypothetical protein